MFSFRFLNPHLVHQQPQTWGAGSEDSICYHGGGGGGIHGNNYDELPDTLCRDLPPNRLRFLGWWYLTPERHFQEWVGFVVVGLLLLIVLGPKVQQIALASSSSSSSYANANANTKKDKDGTTTCTTATCTAAIASSYLTPKQWMIAATVWCYPYVAYTKLSWEGSYYPGRWLMFVGMPVGTLWILSVLFCGTAIMVGTTTVAGGATTAGIRSSSVPVRNIVRFWIMEIWLSFLPSLGLGLVMALYQGAVSSLRQQYSRGFFASTSGGGGHDGDNANIAYFCHALYCCIVPIYWILIDGNRNSCAGGGGGGGVHNNFSMLTSSTSSTTLSWWQLPLHCALRQLIGTAIAALYYMGIVTPASIVAGLNVNSLLVGYGGTVNFRLWYTMEWFIQGWALRFVLGVVEFVIQWVRMGTTTTNKSK